MTVAIIESRMIKREKDRCWLNAILLAMNEEIFMKDGVWLEDHSYLMNHDLQTIICY